MPRTPEAHKWYLTYLKSNTGFGDKTPPPRTADGKDYAAIVVKLLPPPDTPP